MCLLFLAVGLAARVPSRAASCLYQKFRQEEITDKHFPILKYTNNTYNWVQFGKKAAPNLNLIQGEFLNHF